ncbi:MAG: EF-hand domain-containing protein [Terricaulis sp.]
MRKILIAASAVALLAGGVALAEDAAPAGGPRGHGGMVFQSDSNNDGVVTRQEFDAGHAALFTRLDANSDGALTREEHRAGRGGHRGGGRHGGGHGLGDRADANHDGAISRDEFLAQPIAFFDRLDANDDGVISAEERTAARERGQERRGDRQERRANRPNIDADNNGSISRAEFDASGAARFAALDANHDNRVTREEADAARPHRGGEH